MVRTWVTNWAQDMGGARCILGLRGCARHNSFTDSIAVQMARPVAHASGEPDSKYDARSYFESGVLALHSVSSERPLVAE